MTLLRRLVAAASWTCAAATLLWWITLRLAGERWWPATVGLYLPQVVLLLPVVVLAGLAWVVGPRRSLVPLSVAAGIVLFPVMGLTLSIPVRRDPGAARLRVLSFNTDSGRRSLPDLVEEVVAARPDVVVLQETGPLANGAVTRALPPSFHTLASTQFFVASRYPITRLLEPGMLRVAGVQRSPRFIRVTIETPSGPVDVFDVHPISPREALDSVQGDGILVGLRTGAILEPNRKVIRRNTELRRSQVMAIAELAAASPHPVIIAGDTNLPQSSPMLGTLLDRWRDGFSAVGQGFGYTFPVGRKGAWMRIDRILASPQLRFVEFGVGRRRGSDHHCVWAELEWPARP